MSNIFSILFNDNEHTCFSASAKGTTVMPIDSFSSAEHAFFSINPLNPTTDNNPTEAYHAANKPRRADHNVVVYRNFLIEMDGLPLEEQLPLIREKLGDCFTTVVFSGGKSLHCIISLDVDLASRQEYDQIALKLHKLFDCKADKSTKNPSRFSRCPDHLRADKNQVQEVLAIGTRVSLALLEKQFAKFDISLPKPREKKKPFLPPAHYCSVARFASLAPWIQRFLRDGAPAGNWVNTLFPASCAAAERGILIEEWLYRCEQITGHLDKEDVTTVRGAYARVEAQR